MSKHIFKRNQVYFTDVGDVVCVQAQVYDYVIYTILNNKLPWRENGVYQTLVPNTDTWVLKTESAESEYPFVRCFSDEQSRHRSGFSMDHYILLSVVGEYATCIKYVYSVDPTCHSFAVESMPQEPFMPQGDFASTGQTVLISLSQWEAMSQNPSPLPYKTGQIYRNTVTGVQVKIFGKVFDLLVLSFGGESSARDSVCYCLPGKLSDWVLVEDSRSPENDIKKVCLNPDLHDFVFIKESSTSFCDYYIVSKNNGTTVSGFQYRYADTGRLDRPTRKSIQMVYWPHSFKLPLLQWQRLLKRNISELRDLDLSPLESDSYDFCQGCEVVKTLTCPAICNFVVENPCAVSELTL